MHFANQYIIPEKRSYLIPRSEHMLDGIIAFVVPVLPDGSALQRKLKPGDSLIVKDVSTTEGFSELPATVEDADAIEVSIFYADTSGQKQPKVQYQFGVAIATAVQQILLQMEQAEAIIRKEAVLKGFAKAKEKGIKPGRRPMARHENFDEVHRQWKNGEISDSTAAKLLGVSRPTFKRWASEC